MKSEIEKVLMKTGKRKKSQKRKLSPCFLVKLGYFYSSSSRGTGVNFATTCNRPGISDSVFRCKPLRKGKLIVSVILFHFL